MVKTEDGTMLKKFYKNVALGLSSWTPRKTCQDVKMYTACRLFNIIILGLANSLYVFRDPYLLSRAKHKHLPDLVLNIFIIENDLDII